MNATNITTPIGDLANASATRAAALEGLGWAAFHLAQVQPMIPTYLHMIIGALFPIIAGVHASLTQPSSAAPASAASATSRARRLGGHRRGRDGRLLADTPRRMEGLSPADAIFYPILAGCTLGGLYLLIKWLDDPALLNRLLNAYLALFGAIAVTRLLTDTCSFLLSFVFPERFVRKGEAVVVDSKTRSLLLLGHSSSSQGVESILHVAPMPLLCSLPLPKALVGLIWRARAACFEPILELESELAGLFETHISVQPQDLVCLLLSLASIAYYNLFSRPWLLNNLLGISFSYHALQLLTPTTFTTGSLVLAALFGYDVYMVFFSPLMITVAKALDVPVKLLFPRPPGANEDPTRTALSMLGLGDIVLPGIMIGLALRFDLYVFYLRKQHQKAPASIKSEAGEHAESTVKATQQNPQPSDSDALIYDNDGLGKVEYAPATRGWGERFWLDYASRLQDGGTFPKVYFAASIVGYILGLLTTIGVMQVFQHGQPALLYLVPGVLGSLWGTALVRGEIGLMWAYTEETAADEEAKKAAGEKSTTDTAVEKEDSTEVGSAVGSEDSGSDSSDIEESSAKQNRLVYFALSRPQPAEDENTVEEPEPPKEDFQNVEPRRLRSAAEPQTPEKTANGSANKALTTGHSPSAEPPEKRRRKA